MSDEALSLEIFCECEIRSTYLNEAVKFGNCERKERGVFLFEHHRGLDDKKAGICQKHLPWKLNHSNNTTTAHVQNSII